MKIVEEVFEQIRDTPYSQVAENRIRQESNLQKTKRAAAEKKIKAAQHALERFEGEILKCLDGTSNFTEDMIAKQIRRYQQELDDAKAEYAELQNARLNEAAEIRKLRTYYDDFNETEVVTSESVKGKRKTSILGTKARLWLITINNPQNHGISLEQSEILERFKEDIKTGRVTYVASVMEQSLTVDENDKHTPHGHIAAYFPSQELGGHLHKLFPMAALQDCKANILSVRQYLIKDPTGAWYKKYPEKFGEKLPDDEANFWEWGIIPDGRRKSADSQSSKTLSEDVLQAIREGKNDAEILTKFPTVWNRSAELRKIRFAIMSQKYRPIYRDLNCIYVEANFPPKEAYKLFAHTPDTYVVSDYTHPWDSYCAEKTVVLTEYVGQFPWFEIRRLLSGNYCTLPARFSDAVACYTNIIIISPLRFAEMCKCGKGYNPNILISYFTHSRRYLDLADFGTDYVLNPTSGDWEQRYLLPPHVEPKKENDHDESEQQ